MTRKYTVLGSHEGPMLLAAFEERSSSWSERAQQCANVLDAVVSGDRQSFGEVLSGIDGVLGQLVGVDDDSSLQEYLGTLKFGDPWSVASELPGAAKLWVGPFLAGAKPMPSRETVARWREQYLAKEKALSDLRS